MTELSKIYAEEHAHRNLLLDLCYNERRLGAIGQADIAATAQAMTALIVKRQGLIKTATIVVIGLAGRRLKHSAACAGMIEALRTGFANPSIAEDQKIEGAIVLDRYCDSHADSFEPQLEELTRSVFAPVEFPTAKPISDITQLKPVPARRRRRNPVRRVTTASVA